MKFWMILSSLVFFVSCQQQEHHEVRITFKLEDIPFFISEPIKYVEVVYDERLIIPLSASDSESLNEVFQEMHNAKVNVFIGDRYYSEIRMINAEDYSKLNLPYLNNADEIFESQGVEVRDFSGG